MVVDAPCQELQTSSPSVALANLPHVSGGCYQILLQSFFVVNQKLYIFFGFIKAKLMARLSLTKSVKSYFTDTRQFTDKQSVRYPLKGFEVKL